MIILERTMRDILICTVGTSLLGNLARSEDADILSLLEERNEKGVVVALGKIAQEERICGAEINSIASILKHGYLNERSRLVFLVSDTDDGRFLGQVLKLYYELSGKSWRFDDVEVSTIEGLTHADARLFRTSGLRNLVRLIARTVEQYGSNRIVINATEQLLGIEGNAAKAYFQGLGRMILGDFIFNGRKKRPPPDPVNALLSFSYTLIFNEISSLLDGMGFDPYLGYLHKPDYGRPSLACDLIEEFRPIAGDRLTLNLINNRILFCDHFHSHSTGKGVYLTREGMKKFFSEYERFLTQEFRHPISGETVTLRRCFRLQAEMMARCVREGTEYLPLLLTV